jgi:hypothetical protein
MKIRVLCALLVFALVLAAPGLVRADFTGDYAIANWTFSNNPPGAAGSFNTVAGPPIQLFVVGGDAGVAGDSDFTITIVADGEITFDWGYQSTDVQDFDLGGYVLNGTFTQLAGTDSQVPFFNGSATVPVSAGDVFAFRALTEDGLFGAGTLGITDFNFAVAVQPEMTVSPASLAASQEPDVQTVQNLTIGNIGDADLDWTIGEAGPAPVTAQPAAGGNPFRQLGANPQSSRPYAPLLGAIVQDGGFEAGSPNPAWTEASSNFGTPLCTVAGCGTGAGTGPRSGTWWAWFGGTTALEEGSMTQSVTIPPGVATLVFYTEAPVCDSAGFLEVTIDGTQVFQMTNTDASCGTVGYVQRTVDISSYADGGAHALAFHSITQPGANVTNFFVDDVSIGVEPIICGTAQDLGWLSLSSTAGTTAPAGSTVIQVTFDSTGLAPGLYEGSLCVESNDPGTGTVAVPVSLEVTEGQGGGGPSILEIPTLGEIGLAALALLLGAGALLQIRRRALS